MTRTSPAILAQRVTTTLKGQGGGIILRPDSRPSWGTGGVVGIIRRDPETVLVPPTTTLIQDQTSRAGTEKTRLFTLVLLVRAQSVRSHAVTSSAFSESVFNPESSNKLTVHRRTLIPCIAYGSNLTYFRIEEIDQTLYPNSG